MQKEIEIALAPESVHDDARIITAGSKQLRVSPERINGCVVRKLSFDERGIEVLFRVRVFLYIDLLFFLPTFFSFIKRVYTSKPVISFGAGPARIFVAYRCLEW